MSTTHIPATHRARASRGQGGQILVLFTLALVAIIAMVGLVIDGGSAYAQRRDQQNVADLAALAGATAYLNTTGDVATKTAAAEAAAADLATENGFTSGADVAVDVDVTTSGPYATVKVGIGAPHQNHFVGVIGMPVWGVSVDATAEATGSPNTAIGALPLIFNIEAFNDKVCTLGKGNCPDQVFNEPGNGNEDVPQDATQFNWTIFCQANGNPCNANTNGVRDLIDGNGGKVKVDLGMDIGPLNAGSHTALFSDLEQHVGSVFPVPIVDDDGVMLGFAYFLLTGVEGASEKVIRGYFLAPYEAGDMTYTPGAGDASLDTGAYSLGLID
jgi:Flp pilus assembly protein TadG